MRNLRFLTLLLVFLTCASGQAVDFTATFDTDRLNSQEYRQKVTDAIAMEAGLTGEEFLAQLEQAHETESVDLPKPARVKRPFDLFEYGRDRTYVLARPVQSTKDESWSLKSATAWAMGENGVFMTNYHVLEGGLAAGGAVVNYDLECFPITEVLVADKAADFVVFRAALPTGRTIKAFPIGESEPAGNEIYLVSHPNAYYYYLSRGHLARYTNHRGYKAADEAPKILWMNTELGFSPGSSGGGIFNAEGKIVGMVSFIKPHFDIVALDSDKDKYARKIFEFSVPVQNFSKRINLVTRK